MAVRNGEPYLKEAIDSILAQTYPDFRFLIVDDASTDGTRGLVLSYNDDRIDLLPLEKNVGQTAALNIGLTKISTEWVARMDADDYSTPERFEAQMQLCDSDPSIGCVGTFAWYFCYDPRTSQGTISKPITHDEIKEALLWMSPIIHGSIVARTEALVEAGAYDERYRYSADLDLYDRLLAKCRGANVPRPLLGIRRHPGQDSHSTKAIQESIQILSGRLANGHYSRRERSVIRAAKALHEGLCAKIERNYPQLLLNMVEALWFSPAITLHHFKPKA